MVDCSRDATIDLIQTLESMLGLAYNPSLEPLLVMVVDASIQLISACIEGVRFGGPTRGSKNV